MAQRGQGGTVLGAGELFRSMRFCLLGNRKILTLERILLPVCVRGNSEMFAVDVRQLDKQLAHFWACLK